MRFCTLKKSTGTFLQLVFFVIYCNAVPVCDENTYTLYLLNLCEQSPLCSASFYLNYGDISEKTAKFEYLLDFMLKKTSVTIEMICESSKTANVWIGAMEIVEFCSETKIVDQKGKCICLDKKQCKEIIPDVYRFNDFLIILIIIGIAFILVWTGGKMLMWLVKNHRLLLQISKSRIKS